MRKLGEQWVEEIDGKEHMVKAVKQTNKCSGCVFCTSIWCADHNQSERDFDCMTMIIKDLGILNEDGLLPCPFCGEYPENDTKDYCQFGFVVRHVCKNNKTAMGTSNYKTKQEAIDAWNRRA
jgi:Lar family restriction alleviation protein